MVNLTSWASLFAFAFLGNFPEEYKCVNDSPFFHPSLHTVLYEGSCPNFSPFPMDYSLALEVDQVRLFVGMAGV